MIRGACRLRACPLSRIDIAGAREFYPGLSNFEAGHMFRICFALLFALLAAQVVLAPQALAQQGHDACARDVSRFCRAQMNDGDSVVLACLKQHRARISKACNKVMTDNGQ